MLEMIMEKEIEEQRRNTKKKNHFQSKCNISMPISKKISIKVPMVVPKEKSRKIKFGKLNK